MIARKLRSFFAVSLTLGAGSTALFHAPSPVYAQLVSTPPAERSSRATLMALLDEQYHANLKANPIEATILGEQGYDSKLPDLSRAGIDARRAASVLRLTRLKELKPDAGWSEDDRLSADLLALELTMAIEGAKFFPEHYVLDDRSGPQIWLPELPDRLPIRSFQDQLKYMSRLEAAPKLIDDAVALLKEAVAAKRVPPRTAVAFVLSQTKNLASKKFIDAPEESPFFRPFATLEADDPTAQNAKSVIAEQLVPAFGRLAAYLESTYLPACRETFAASSSIDGPAYYAHQLKLHTTTNLTPDEIHALGISEVARIRTEMFEVIARTDFPQKETLKGDELFRAFVADLRTNPKFYHTTPRDLLAGYRDIAKRIDAELPRFFAVLPRNPYGVRETPRTAAEAAPTAYYYRGSLKGGTSGTFMANTFALNQRPKYEMIALTLHEAMPGHHLQIALADELQNVHPFRRQTDFTVFIEGWALYAERLGLEMSASRYPTIPDDTNARTRDNTRGLFADPYDDFGRLNYEMWRAARLVVDTGLHAKNWTRQQAIDYMIENTALSPLNIEREVDRYIAWPGQACAYKIGELAIRKLRDQAQQTLGQRFDLRAFHDHLLGAGALPLSTLEARMKRWIDAQNPR
ncbi:MAG: DUF885 domain-containing protein [Phycisphaerales bacterium]|nr:DUF885 domain-containing protein [Phycisphaerales bacterium]